jgi:hypothetical protein
MEEYFSRDGKITFDGKQAVNRHYFSVIENRELLTSLIRRYIEDLERIIQNAPPTYGYTLVFRGIKNDYLADSAATDTPVAQKGFMSTSFNPVRSIRFTGASRTMYEMIIAPGTPCLALGDLSHFQHESEVLISSETATLSMPKVTKHLLQDAPFAGAFPPEHLWSPQDPLSRFRTRTVSVVGFSGAAVGGRMITTRRRSSSTRRQTKQSKQSRRSKQSRHPIDVNPVLLPHVPIPANIQDVLRRALGPDRFKAWRA